MIRERVAALWIEARRAEALEELQPLLDVAQPAYDDVLDAARIEYTLASPEDFERVRGLLERASALRPDAPAPYYLLGQLALGDGDFETARDHLRRAYELAPDDYPTRLALANVLAELGEEEAAEAHYRALVAIGPDVAGAWHVSTIWRLGQMLRWRDDPEGERLIAQRQEFEAQGLKPPSSERILQGNFGFISWTRPPGSPAPEPPRPLAPLQGAGTLPAELAGATGIAAWTLHENWERVVAEGSREPASTEVGPPDLVAWGDAGVVIASGAGGWSVRTITDGPADRVLALDVDNDGDLDFLVVRGAEVRLRVTGPDGWSDLESAWPELPGPPSDALVVDHDHEGDLDLLFVGAFGARLWRNDGHAGPVTDDGAAPGGEAQGPPDAEPRAAFVDVTEEAGLPTSGALEWCIAEDLDTDQDVDFLVGGAEGARLFDSRRGGVFAEASDGLPAGAMPEPVVADLDGDAWPDLWVPGGDGTATVYTRRPSGAYAKEATGVGPAGADYTNLRGVDVDLDGALDAVWDAADGTHAALLLRTGGTAATLSGTGGASASADLDGDGAFDLALSAGDGARILRGVPAGDRRSFRLALHAPERDNRRGVGAVVEIRAGTLYRRIFWTGQPRTIGLGDRDTVDIVRVTWPRGVEQHDLDVAAGARWCIERVQRIEGSCPFLYTWNGETYEFVTDVLGITPLGLPMAPGVMVPPDHDEYVLVRGEQMVPRTEDGRSFLELQITEELREVTYLDRVRLEVVDHPVGTEVFPNERFSFPPFPEPHTHVMRDPLAPVRAVDDRGVGWADELAAIDDDYAIPFVPYCSLYTGLAAPHFLELEFDAEAVADAELLRLVCTGWFLWSDASINMLAARTPGVDFVPPVLSVPDPTAASGWRETGPPVGFPAGKRKTMVLDVSELLDRDDPRIRISGTLCLYWDSIRLATDDDDEELRVTRVEPVSAHLWQRGFSRSFKPLEGHMLEWFDWDALDEPRWDPHPGAYTRLGETLPLLTAIDDRFVILGAGDALRVRFDAEGLPPLADGWRRDYLLFLDGWAKDRDPNTLEALWVEPLPFHGMSGYPYGPDESFPDTEAHRAWRREWNTREPTTWIEPLAPNRGRPRVAAR